MIILGFARHAVSVTKTQLCHRKASSARDSPEADKRVCSPVLMHVFGWQYHVFDTYYNFITCLNILKEKVLPPFIFEIVMIILEL